LPGFNDENWKAAGLSAVLVHQIEQFHHYSKPCNMNKHQRFVIVFFGLLLFLANGCLLSSIHPIYTKDKLVTVKELPGVWSDKPGDISFNKKQKILGQEKDVKVTVYQQEEDQAETWKFKANADKQYLLIHTDNKGRSAAFTVHLIKLGDNLFMDFFPTSLSEKEKGIAGVAEGINSMREIHLHPVHTFAKLETSQSELKISMFDPEFMANLLKRQQIRIKHEKTEEGFILTASPEELQKFAEKYAHVKEAFLEEPIVLTKKQ